MSETAPSLSPASLPSNARTFLEAPSRFAVVATTNADGTPHQAVIWYYVSDKGIVFNSAEGRIWPANLRRDPHASLIVEDGYLYVAVRGEVEVIDDPERAQADIARLARTYHADDPALAERMIETRFRTQRRVSFVLHPRHVVVHED